MTSCKERLVAYLAENHVPFQTQRHHTAFTAQEIAAEQKVPGREMAKVVMVIAEGKAAMVVLPATHRVDFTKLARVLACPDARLAHEPEFAGLFPDCDTGAMPPFGNLYDVPVLVDRALAAESEIVFNVGTHTDTLRVPYEAYARLVHPIVADLAAHV